MERCSSKKHIIVCGCDPDFFEVNELINPNADCCNVGVCKFHEECERHGPCPAPGQPEKDEEEEEKNCLYEHVGQCTLFIMGPNRERARCSNSLDGVADSAICPECVTRFYPRQLCDRGCGQARRRVYDYLAGAWLQVCPCDDESSSSEEEGEGERKKQKTDE